MRRFTLSVLTAALLLGSASGQKLQSPSVMRSKAKTESVKKFRKADERIEKKRADRKARMRKAPLRRANASTTIAPPSADDKLIDQTPAGKMTTYVKSGFSFGYHWFLGMISQNLYGGVNNVVISDDNKKVYVQNPVYFNTLSAQNWIEGDLQDNVVTFTFPQMIDADETYDENNELLDAIYDYAMVLEFVVEDPETQEGWYYPSDKQTYKFRLESDGTLTPMEDENLMIGACSYWDSIEEDPAGATGEWSWIGNGDFIDELKPLTDKTVEAPAGAEFSEWQMITGISSRPVQIAEVGGKMYFKGLSEDLPDAVLEGTVDGSKITFKSGQYMGIIEDYGCTAYFLGGDIMEEEEDGEVYQSFDIENSLVFDYNKRQNVIKSAKSYCISSSPAHVLFYELGEQPYICIPKENFIVGKLYTPVLNMFWDVDEEYDYDAAIDFNFPTVTPDMNLLPTDRLYYQVILDDEIYTFYDDEYELPEGVTETTEIPFGYNSIETYDFSASGIEHSVEIHSRGFESFGVRTLYKPLAGKPVYSDILWAPGYEGEFSAVKGIMADREVKSAEYYDLNGLRLSCPAKGVSLMRVTLSDGSVETRKVVR